MDTSPVRRDVLHISFFNNPKLVGGLLLEIISYSQRGGGVLTVEDIEHIAQELRYTGPLQGMCRFLLMSGFISEVEKEKRFTIHEHNREKIMDHFMKHGCTFVRYELSHDERARIFAYEAKGSPVELSVGRIMRLLSALLEELDQLPLLNDDVQYERAEREVISYAVSERLQWLSERVDRTSQHAEAMQRAHGFDSPQFHTALEEYLETYDQFMTVTSVAEKSNGKLIATLHDATVLNELTSLTPLMRRLVAAFLQHEESI